MLIANTPMVMFVDSEVEESEEEILDDSDWNASLGTQQRHLSCGPFRAQKSTKSDQPLHMSLRS